jgi:hypothetical protein
MMYAIISLVISGLIFYTGIKYFLRSEGTLADYI